MMGASEERGLAMFGNSADGPQDKWTTERVLAIRYWTSTLVSFRTTRYRGFRVTPTHREIEVLDALAGFDENPNSCSDRSMAKKFPLHPKHPERICWGCDKYCAVDSLECGNGSDRTQHPVESLGEDWLEYGDWEIEVSTESSRTIRPYCSVAEREVESNQPMTLFEQDKFDLPR